MNGSASDSLWVFFALTYGLTWLAWIPAALSGEDVTMSGWLIPYVLGGFGPSVAGIIMVYQSMGQAGRRQFWRRITDFGRISLGWYLFILFVFPVLFAVSFLFDRLGGNPLPEFEVLARIMSDPVMLVGMAVTGIVTGPLSEELGWRGFALDQLQVRWSPLVSSLILAALWWGWHLPLFFIKGTTQHSWGLGTPSFWLFLLGTVPLAIVLTWVCNHNGRSILAAILAHFAYNVTLGLVYPFSVSVYVLYTILMFVVAGVLVLSGKSRFGRIWHPASSDIPRRGRSADS